MTITLNPFKLLDRPRKPAAVETPFAGYQRDPFDAVPVLNEQAEVREDSRSCYQVKMRMKPAAGMATFLADKLGFHRDMRIDLDPQGSFFWSQVDGHRNLHFIEEQIRKKFTMEPEESRKATLLFTKMLMLRHLIHLDIGDKHTEEEQPIAEAIPHA